MLRKYTMDHISKLQSPFKILMEDLILIQHQGSSKVATIEELTEVIKSHIIRDISDYIDVDIDDKLSEINRRLDELSRRLMTKADIEYVDNSINSLESSIDDKIVMLRTELTNIINNKADKEYVDNAITSITNTINGLNQSISSITSTITTINETIQNNYNELTNIIGTKANKTDVDEAIGDINNILSSLNQSINSITSTISTINETIQNNYNELTSSINTKADKTYVDEAITSITNTIDNLNQAVSNITSTITTINETIQNNYTELNDKIDANSTAFNQLVRDVVRSLVSKREFVRYMRDGYTVDQYGNIVDTDPEDETLVSAVRNVVNGIENGTIKTQSGAKLNFVVTNVPREIEGVIPQILTELDKIYGNVVITKNPETSDDPIIYNGTSELERSVIDFLNDGFEINEERHHIVFSKY